jgi:uncharacterized damage-inducible protein DinB
MMKPMKPLQTLCLLALVVPTLAFGRVQTQQPATKPASLPAGFRGECIANMNEVEEKLMELAESTPAEKYSWRPGTGVRSISEVYMHIAGSNYLLLTFIGVKAPANLDNDMEKNVTSKSAVISELRRSFEHLRKSIEAMPDSELEKPVKMFGTQTTERGVLLTTISHLHEHLGQSIAYARTNGVAPPWSR